jgi:hypothetical protein
VKSFDTDMPFDLVLRDGRVAARVTEVSEKA